MRILLIAYEFPPGPSPQSLRWARLAGELAQRGVDVHVLSVQRGGERVRLDVPARVVVHRTPAGAASGLVAWLRSRQESETGRSQPASSPGNPAAPSTFPLADDLAGELNWKGRLVAGLDRVAGKFTFPDPFGQWELSARLRLRGLLCELQPDVVVSSHEPATTLRLGRIAKQAGFPWLADLGDPVLSVGTPRRWRRLAERVEAWTCRHADHVTVTTEATKRLLASRHSAPEPRFTVLTQGFDPVGRGPGAEANPVAFDADRLELVYTGSFYAFRHPRHLVDAVLACDAARLTIATRTPPEWLVATAEAHPGRIRLAGFLRHGQAVAMQRSADVLVNVANDDAVQLPGKLFEYLGAGRPILHLGCGDVDVAASLLRGRRRGLAVANDAEAIGGALQRLLDIKRAGAWEREFELGEGGFAEYEWTNIADRLHGLLVQVMAARSA